MRTKSGPGALPASRRPFAFARALSGPFFNPAVYWLGNVGTEPIVPPQGTEPIVPTNFKPAKRYFHKNGFWHTVIEFRLANDRI